MWWHTVVRTQGRPMTWCCESVTLGFYSLGLLHGFLVSESCVSPWSAVAKDLGFMTYRFILFNDLVLPKAWLSCMTWWLVVRHSPWPAVFEGLACSMTWLEVVAMVSPWPAVVWGLDFFMTAVLMTWVSPWLGVVKRLGFLALWRLFLFPCPGFVRCVGFPKLDY